MGKHEGERGFTYVEVVVCLCIAVMIVGPFSSAFLSSIKTKVAADDLKQATGYGEQLILQIKERIAKDLILQQQIEGRLVDATKLLKEEKERIHSGINQYLMPLSEAGIGTRKNYLLSKWLNESTTQLQKSYDTDRYAYEIAIWPINDIPKTNGMFKLTNEVLTHATKIYTDETFQFVLSSDEEKDWQQITLKDAKDYFGISYSDKFNISRTSILFDEAGKFEEKQVAGYLDPMPVQLTFVSEIKDVHGKRCGYHFSIDETGSYGGGKSQKEWIYQVELDVRKWIRNEKLEKITDFDDYTFKFTNQTPYNVVIVTSQNVYYEKGKNQVETEENKRIARAEVNQKFRVITECLGSGRITIMRSEPCEINPTYMIIMQIRDKAPVWGKGGKRIKQMVDFYSFNEGKTY